MSKPKQEVVTWKERMAAKAVEVAKLERPKLSQISTRSGILSYNQQPFPGNKLDCIVLGAVFEKNWFASAFDPMNPRNPDCYAMSMTGEPGAPHPAVENPQGLACDPNSCPRAKFEMRANGRKNKECKDIRRLCVMPVSALKSADDVAKAEVAMLRVPVTSVKNWKLYVNTVSAGHQRPPEYVITTISCRPHMKNQFEMLFEMASLVDDEFGPAIEARVPSIAELLTQAYDKNAAVEPPKDSKKF